MNSATAPTRFAQSDNNNGSNATGNARMEGEIRAENSSHLQFLLSWCSNPDGRGDKPKESKKEKKQDTSSSNTNGNSGSTQNSNSKEPQITDKGTLVFDSKGNYLGTYPYKVGEKKAFVIHRNPETNKPFEVKNLRDFAGAVALYAKLNNLTIDNALSIFGSFYDLKASSDFFDKNGQKFIANKMNGINVNVNETDRHTYNRKPATFYAEAISNTVLVNNTVTVGKVVNTEYDGGYTFPGGLPQTDIAPIVGNIHTHPVVKEGNSTFNFWWKGGYVMQDAGSVEKDGPSGNVDEAGSGDLGAASELQKHMNVIVDKKDIYLYNGLGTIIKIKR